MPVINAVAPVSGMQTGGFVVTLQGTDLGNNDVTSVTFGGVSVLDSTWISATSVTVEAPSVNGAGTVDVALISTSFGTVNAVGIFSYISRAISSITPNSGPMVGGTVVTITVRCLETNDFL